MFSAHTLVGLTALTLLLHAAWTDIRFRLIYNTTTALLVVCFAVAVTTGPMPVTIAGGLAMAGLTFAAGFVLWRFRLLGGGDVKLLSVLALWAGLAQGLEFLVVTALAGGVLALVQITMNSRNGWAFADWLGHAFPAVAGAATANDADMASSVNASATGGHGTGTGPVPPTQLPYGVAIACGGAWVLFNQFAA